MCNQLPDRQANATAICVVIERKPSHKKREMTEEEEFYLWQHKDIFDVPELAARLERSELSVYSKLRQLEKKNVLPC